MKIRTYKIIIIGDCNVGKTSLSFRFCEGQFPTEVAPTIGLDFREKKVDVNGEVIKLQIWDTAGQEKFRGSMVPHYYRNAHAVVFVYDMTNLSSFTNLPIWIEECYKHTPTAVVKILVGNKCDSTNPEPIVETHKAQCFADNYNMPLFETSARDASECDHVASIFLTIAHKLKAERLMMPDINLPSNDSKVILDETNEGTSEYSLNCC